MYFKKHFSPRHRHGGNIRYSVCPFKELFSQAHFCDLNPELLIFVVTFLALLANIRPG
jgi:hypothetical protein